MNEISDFERVLTLIYNIIMSLVAPLIQLPFSLFMQFYNCIDSMVAGIIGAIDVFNGNNEEQNDDE